MKNNLHLDDGTKILAWEEKKEREQIFARATVDADDEMMPRQTQTHRSLVRWRWASASKHFSNKYYRNFACRSFF